MENDKLLEILEKGSEQELTLIQNYLLDKILKKSETTELSDVAKRAIDTSDKILEITKRLEELESKLKLLENLPFTTTPAVDWTWPDSITTTSPTIAYDSYSTVCNNSFVASKS